MSFHVHCDVPGCASTVPAYVDFYDHRCDTPGNFGFPSDRPWRQLDPVPDGEENENWPQGAAHICPEHDPRFVKLLDGLHELSSGLKDLHSAEPWHWRSWLENATRRFEEACR